MSVRKRTITNRLARDLQLEQEEHAKTHIQLQATHNSLRQTTVERDALRNECDALRKLAIEMASCFTDPPVPLTRDSRLFRLLSQFVPRHIPPMRTTPQELLHATLRSAGVEIDELMGWIGQSGIDSISSAGTTFD